jgi:hypothetical protein
MKQIKSKQVLELLEAPEEIKAIGDEISIPLLLPHHSVSLLVFEPL